MLVKRSSEWPGLMVVVVLLTAAPILSRSALAQQCYCAPGADCRGMICGQQGDRSEGDESPIVKGGRDSTYGAPSAGRRGGGGSMQWSNNQYVEGDGDIDSFPASKSQCAQACLAEPGCRFLEYHRPTNKCNLFSHVPRVLTGNDADVAFKQ
jgi:hypothetical protein